MTTRTTEWVVARPHVLQRAHAAGGGRTVIEWKPDLRYGVHASNVAAKRAFLTSWIGPDVAGNSDDWVKREFAAQRANIGLAKVQKWQGQHGNEGSHLDRGDGRR